MEKIQVFKVRMEKKGPAYTCRCFGSLDWIFEESEIGDQIFIEVAEMDSEEFAQLPEFEGF
jgi:hypothetical protein